LLQKSPEIYKKCFKYASCKPNQQYDLWLPDFFGPLGFVVPNFLTEDCYLNLAQVIFDENKEKDVSKGYTVEWYGNTKST